MIYACRRCQHEDARGCLPSVTCGLMLAVLHGIAISVLIPAVAWLFRDGLGWWWVLAGPVLFLVAIPLALLLYWMLAAVEWIAFCCRRCPECGARSWSRGFSRGFGL